MFKHWREQRQREREIAYREAVAMQIGILPKPAESTKPKAELTKPSDSVKNILDLAPWIYRQRKIWDSTWSMICNELGITKDQAVELYHFEARKRHKI